MFDRIWVACALALAKNDNFPSIFYSSFFCQLFLADWLKGSVITFVVSIGSYVAGCCHKSCENSISQSLHPSFFFTYVTVVSASVSMSLVFSVCFCFRLACLADRP